MDSAAVLKLFGDVHVACAIEPNRGNVASKRGSAEEVLRWAEVQNRSGSNVYFHRNAVRDGVTKKASKLDITHIRAVGDDIDWGWKHHPSKYKERIFELANRQREYTGSPTPPSIAVFTGGGFQNHYILGEPSPATPENVRRAEAISKAIARSRAGDDVSSVDHLVRMPGFINYPHRAKGSAGQPQRVAVVLPGPVRRYSLPELQSIFLRDGVWAQNCISSGAHGAYRGSTPHAGLNADLVAGIGEQFNLHEFESAALHLADCRPSPLAEYHGQAGFGWRDFTFACAFAETVRPEEGCRIRSIWQRASATAGGNAEKNDAIYEHAVRSTPERIGRGESVVRPSTVFEIASRLGWSSTQKEGSSSGTTPGSASSSPGRFQPAVLETVNYEPGNEQACREALDRTVAADPFTFRSGEGLVILRVPNRETLPTEVTWDGDLPSTTIAQPADVIERAERICWLQRAGGKSPDRYRRGKPPRDFCSDYITQMRGRYGARRLMGFTRVPYIDDGGTIITDDGYHARTGVFHDHAPTLSLPAVPTKLDAVDAALRLLRPFEHYTFEDRRAGLLTLFAAVLTALLRPWLRTAPMFVVKGAMAGTGKGQITRAIARLALDTTPVLMSWGHNDEEFQKRLDSMILASPAMLVIDNANGKLLRGGNLEMVLTEGTATIRDFGKLRNVTVRSRSFLMATGNNLSISGDMIRRAFIIDVLPRSASPERDVFPFIPEEYVRKHRIELLEAAYTVMRAHRLAGMPKPQLPAVGSFADWEHEVRDLVSWLFSYDLSEQFEKNKADDPFRQNDAALLAALHAKYGSKPFRAAEVEADYLSVRVFKRSVSAAVPAPGISNEQVAIHDAVEGVWGARPFNTKGFGAWAKQLENAFTDGFLLSLDRDRRSKTNAYVVQKK